MKRSLFLIALVLFSASSALAVESVQFTQQDLNSIVTLMRPELNSIEVHGRKVIFQPAPSIRYLGVEPSETPLDMTVIADVMDLEFNHLKAGTPEVKFKDGALELSVPVKDQNRAIQSVLGSISFSDVALKAKLGWKTNADGSQELVLVRTAFEGELKGTGILRSKFILEKTRQLCVFVLNQSLKKLLSIEKVQSSLASGLMEYAKFYTGYEVREFEPGSIQFFQGGIRYSVNIIQ